MSFKDYLKEKWITFLFMLFAFLFALTVYLLDSSFNIYYSNASYILAGWILLLTTFVFVDYSIYRVRVKKLRDYCQFNASSEDAEDFYYPSDRIYAQQIRDMIVAFETYKAENETRASEEMEFITKWIHDVKVPISAIRLILEHQEDELPADFYKSLDSELFMIEGSLLRVFYEIKSNRFFDDYKIAKVNTGKLIAGALKGYSNFFSYKRIGISIEGEDHEVLTDEKWSGYILSQLISNAVKYTPEEGNITIQTVKTDMRTIISVKNEGKGILDQDIGQVFKKGYTSSESREGVKSTGYGLYLSKKLADLLGHELAAESNYNEYAKFSLIFSKNDTLYQMTKM